MRLQQAGDLVGHEPAVALATKNVGAVRLNVANRLQVLLGHRLVARWDRQPIKTNGGERQKRLVPVQMAHEFASVDAA